MLQLKIVSSINIKTKAPYNFKCTVHKPSHFPSTTVKFENETLYFSMNWKEYILGVKLYEINKSEIKADIFSEKILLEEILKEVKDELIFRFNIQTDLNPFIALANEEPLLKPIVNKYIGMHASCAYSLYELLCISLVLQNAQVTRSAKMLEIMLNNLGVKINFDCVELSVFWKPNDIMLTTEEFLRSLKIGYRAKSFIRISEFFTNNPDFEYTLRTKSKKDASKELQKIYGVGPASTWYLLFEKLHHYDAFDYISPWENKILSMLIFDTLDRPAVEILNYAKEKWGDYRMLAIHYIFEDVFWKRRNENIEWLNKLIKL